ncbi:MAG: metal ABC transporter substrate-binding protein [Ornithinibacter sp.]
MKRAALLLAASLLAASTAACSGAAGSQESNGGQMAVTASFYPLEFAAERVGGEHVHVTNLTKPGSEPHDLELTPRAVGDLTKSRVVIYLSGFQPAVDRAVDTEAGDAAFDVAPLADLSIVSGEGGGPDPHFWLDPVRYAAVVTAVGERFAAVDPEHANTYRANAATLVSDLGTLDSDIAAGLARCESRDLVTSHTAFAYLAQRYDLGQEGIAGVNPDAEPDAGTLRTLTAFVREHDVSTIYTEALVDPAVAETVARETGAGVAVLDPLEGLTDASAGRNYLEVMRANLATLEKGQRCR